MNLRRLLRVTAIGFAVTAAAPPSPGPHLVVGLFFGSIEEGARIFTPTRLLPPDHPEALGHDFPTALQLHTSEVELLTTLGAAVGMKLAPTLQRYPQEPVESWWYPGFAPPPAEMFDDAILVDRGLADQPLPGLRAVAFVAGGTPLAFIVDTRGLTLDQRDMDRATAMGLDITREELLAALHDLRASAAPDRASIVRFPAGASKGGSG